MREEVEGTEGQVTDLKGVLHRIIAKPQSPLSELKKRIEGKSLELRVPKKLGEVYQTREAFRGEVEGLIVELDGLRERGLGTLITDAQDALGGALAALNTDDPAELVDLMADVIETVENLLNKVKTSGIKLLFAKELRNEVKALAKDFRKKSLALAAGVADNIRKLALGVREAFTGNQSIFDTIKGVFVRERGVDISDIVAAQEDEAAKEAQQTGGSSNGEDS
jgi:HAMP domain-containing protein